MIEDLITASSNAGDVRIRTKPRIQSSNCHRRKLNHSSDVPRIRQLCESQILVKQLSPNAKVSQIYLESRRGLSSLNLDEKPALRQTFLQSPQIGTSCQSPTISLLTAAAGSHNRHKTQTEFSIKSPQANHTFSA